MTERERERDREKSERENERKREREKEKERKRDRERERERERKPNLYLKDLKKEQPREKQTLIIPANQPKSFSQERTYPSIQAQRQTSRTYLIQRKRIRIIRLLI